MKPDRDCSFDYLRAALTVLVVVHHAALAYTTFSVYRLPRYTTSTAPVVDGTRSQALDFLVGFNDGFFMPLMFLIAGLFVWPSLRRKGPLSFLKDRARRLLLPFLATTLVLVPLAYYPSYLGTGRPRDVGRFLRDFYFVDGWPAGPSWFLWVLFIFSAVVAILFPALQRWIDRETVLEGKTPLRPFWGVLAWTFGTGLLCWLIGGAVAPFTWWRPFGPFWVQAERAPLYFGYFLLGVGLGRKGTDGPRWHRDAPLFRLWPIWMASAILAYLGVVRAAPLLTADRPMLPSVWVASAGYWLLFATSCACAGLGLTGYFRRRVRGRLGWMESLSANAYLIYLVHYVVIIWLHYALLSWSAPALLKFVVVLIGGVTLSWLAAAQLRRLPLIAAIA